MTHRCDGRLIPLKGRSPSRTGCAVTLSQICSIASKNRNSPGRLAMRRRRGAVALEFAILAIPFFLWLLYIFELSYDLFTQQALDFALHEAVRQIQTGHAQNLASGGQFIADDFCAATRGLLECNNIWVRVQAVPTYPATTPAGSTVSVSSNAPLQDYATLATSSIPINQRGIDLGNYSNILDATGGNSGANRAPYCNAQPSQAILVSAIYLGPSFISGLLPGVLSVRYGAATVHATLSTEAFVTEPEFAPGSAKQSGAMPAPTCLPPGGTPA